MTTIDCMTTVINLNILNVYEQQVPRKPAAVRGKHQGSAERQRTLPEQRIIDITPSSSIVSCSKPQPLQPRNIPTVSTGQAEILFCYPARKEFHDLRAYSASSPAPKGTHIDSYV